MVARQNGKEAERSENKDTDATKDWARAYGGLASQWYAKNETRRISRENIYFQSDKFESEINKEPKCTDSSPPSFWSKEGRGGRKTEFSDWAIQSFPLPYQEILKKNFFEKFPRFLPN